MIGETTPRISNQSSLQVNLYNIVMMTRGVTLIMCPSVTKGAFIVYCNAAALPMYILLIYRSSTQRTAPEVHFLAVTQFSSQCRDRNMTTATYRNADAVDYECSLTVRLRQTMKTILIL